MKAIKIDVVKKTVEDIEISGDLISMYKALECDCVTSVRITDDEILWVDDDGLLHDNPIGAFLFENYPQVLSGHGLILGVTGSGENRSTKLKSESIKELIRFEDVKNLPEPSIHFVNF